MTSYRPHIAGNTETLKSVGGMLRACWGKDARLQKSGMFPLNDKAID